jgi:hypothetical protein
LRHDRHISSDANLIFGIVGIGRRHIASSSYGWSIFEWMSAAATKEEIMKFILFAIATAGILHSSPVAFAGDTFLNQIGRHSGYGISDGYHAPKCYTPNCLTFRRGFTMPPPMMQPPVMLLPEPSYSYSQWTPQSPQYIAQPPVTYRPAPTMHRLPPTTATLTASRPPSATVLLPMPQRHVEQWQPIPYNSAR